MNEMSHNVTFLYCVILFHLNSKKMSTDNITRIILTLFSLIRVTTFYSLSKTATKKLQHAERQKPN